MDAGNNSETNDMKFRIVYDGPALETHEMNVRDLAPALLSLSDALEEAGKTLYGNKTVVSVKVNASFKAGSFGIDRLPHLHLGSNRLLIFYPAIQQQPLRI